MRRSNALGIEITSPNAEAVTAFDALTVEFLAHGRRVPELLASVLAADPGLVVGWAAKALFTVMLARAEILPAAVEAARCARASLDARGGSLRERLYVDAAERAAAGDWTGAAETFEVILEVTPEDSLAAKLAHGLRFMLGDREGMLGSINRVLSRVGLGHAHAGFLLGCKAFALEESGAYREAEFTGRSAVEREPTDAWGMHAVSHTHEMMGRPEDGIRWIETRFRNFEHCNNFRYHLFWHLALFRLETGDNAGVLKLYDEAIRADSTDDFRDIANGASLLQRLEIAGVPVGDRWEELALLCEKRLDDRTLVFADLHYLMALSGAGRVDAAQALAASLSSHPARSLRQSHVAERVGAITAQAMLDYRAGRFIEAANALISVRRSLQLVGGSHAQRDVFEQVMIDAAVRAGHPEARALLLSRLGGRHGVNRFAQQRVRGGAASAMLNAVALSAE